MMTKRVAYAIGAILLACVLFLFFAPNTEAQTHPVWVGNDMTTGTTYTNAAPVESGLTYLQVTESSSWVATFWGYVGTDTIRISPMVSSTSDTTLALPVGAELRFSSVRLSEIRTISGTATAWGE